MPVWLTRLRRRLRATWSRGHDREIRSELLLHLHLLEEEYRARGLSAEDARRAAHRDFGNVTLVQEASHDLFSFRGVEDLVHDVSYAVREMRRRAGFTLAAVGSLALALASVTAAFTVLDAFMIRGLPVPEPDRLVAFSVSHNPAWRRWSYAHYRRWHESSDGLFDVAASLLVERFDAGPPGGDEGADRRVRVSLVTGNYFQVMGVPMAIGSSFTPAHDRVAQPQAVAVISHAFWDRWFGRAPDIVGRTIDLKGQRYVILGVARRGFTGEWIGQPADIWTPLALYAAIVPGASTLFEDQWGSRGTPLRVIGRLRPEASAQQAESAANVIYQRFVSDKAAALGANVPQVVRERGQHIAFTAAANGYSPEHGVYRKPLLILTAIVALVLVVACANFANLLLGRAETRQRELSVRIALGAGRWRLARQSLTECALLAAIAGCVGLVASQWMTMALVKRLAATVQPVELTPGIDGRVLAFCAACVGLVVIVGLWPSLQGTRTRVTLSSLNRSSSTESRRRIRFGSGQALLAGQLALCTILLVGAGLFVRTVVNLRTQPLGFDRNVLLVALAPGAAGYTPQASAMLLQSSRERLAAMPGITAVTTSGAGLMNNTNYWIDSSERLAIDSGPAPAGLAWTSAAVGPGFFRTIGTPLVAGREFNEGDWNAPADVAIVNLALARFLFGSANPIGRRIGTGAPSANLIIVGVVNDTKQTSPRDRGIGVVYRPLVGDLGRVGLVVRTAGSAAAVAPLVRHELRSLDKNLPIVSVQTIEQQLDEAIAEERLIGVLSLSLGVVAIVIACIGLHALLSYDVAQRTHEIGVRMAMGATGRNVAGLVLGDLSILVAVALAAGLPIGVALTRPLTSQLYGVQPDDPSTLGVVVLSLGAAAALAALRPVRAALGTDPSTLLRHE